jgi:glycosyltransferase involved in cell wall biosynthesis
MKQQSDVYAVVVGAAFEGEEWREKELVKTISQSPYSERIIYAGYRIDTEYIYKLLDVFVLPSINPDPFPTVVLEAMATGKPIVSYRHGGVCEMVNDAENGYLTDVGNPSSLADAILELLKDENKRKEMGVASRKKLVNSFSTDSYVKKYTKTYEEICGK